MPTGYPPQHLSKINTNCLKVERIYGDGGKALVGYFSAEYSDILAQHYPATVYAITPVTITQAFPGGPVLSEKPREDMDPKPDVEPGAEPGSNP